MTMSYFCPQWKSNISDNLYFCAKCGSHLLRTAAHQSKLDNSHISNKSNKMALLLCCFLGQLGLHRFYVGRVKTGILMIVTFGGAGIWTLMDLIKILCQEFKDKDGNKLVFKTSYTNANIDKINKTYNDTIRILFGYKVNNDGISSLRASSILAKIFLNFVVLISIPLFILLIINVINTTPDYKGKPSLPTSSTSSQINR